MIYLLIAQLLSLLLDLFDISRASERDKDLQILLLRHQLRILQRQHQHKPNVSRLDKLNLAVLAVKLIAPTRLAKARLDGVLLLFKPDTPWLCREPWSCAGIVISSDVSGLSSGSLFYLVAPPIVNWSTYCYDWQGRTQDGDTASCMVNS